MFYKDTKLQIFKRFSSKKGIKYFFIRNSSDIESFDNKIYKHLQKNKLVVSWSGGKDSTVSVELLFRAGKNPLILLCDMGYEFDETYDYISKMIDVWQKKYNAFIVVLDTQYFFLDRIFTPYIKGEFKGLIRGFPHAVGMDFCTRDGKTQTSNNFLFSNCKELNFNFGIKENKKLIENQNLSIIKNKAYENIEVSIGYAVDENRSTQDHKNFKYIYPLKANNLTEIEVLKLTKKWNIYNTYYDYYFRGGVYWLPKTTSRRDQSNYRVLSLSMAKVEINRKRVA